MRSHLAAVQACARLFRSGTLGYPKLPASDQIPEQAFPLDPERARSHPSEPVQLVVQFSNRGSCHRVRFNLPDERYNTLGSMKMTGFWSLIALNNKPFAWIGERGMTTLARYEPNAWPATRKSHLDPCSAQKESFGTLRMIMTTVPDSHSWTSNSKAASIILTTWTESKFRGFIHDLNGQAKCIDPNIQCSDNGICTPGQKQGIYNLQIVFLQLLYVP